MLLGMKRLSIACVMAAVPAFLAAALAAGDARATDYYLDSRTGNDSQNGRSASAAWRTVAPLGSVTFAPGDHVYFARGSSFDTTNRFATSGWDPGVWTQADSAGTAANPITFTSYGTGARPVLHNTHDIEGSSVFTLRGAYTVLDDLELNDTHGGAIIIEDTAAHVTITHCDIHHVGAGATVYGAYARITQNHLHDGVMIHNTPGGDDDYGANGVVVSASNVEISYNVAERLIAPCMDFGVDGGFVELYGAVSDLSVHHNTVSDSDGFCEGGSSNNAAISRLTFAYNLSVDDRSFFVFHNGGDHFAAVFSNVVASNNTIVETTGTPTLFWASSDPSAGSFTIENNIIAAPGGRVYQRPGAITHRHNLYPPTSTVGVALDATERAVDPMFVSAATRDFHLRAGSAAIDVGVAAAFASDLDGVAVPAGAGVDLGAFEYVAPGTDAGAPVDASMLPDVVTNPTDAGAVMDSGTMAGDAAMDGSTSGPDAALRDVLGGEIHAPADVADESTGGAVHGQCSCDAAGARARSRNAIWCVLLAFIALSARRSRQRRARDRG